MSADAPSAVVEPPAFEAPFAPPDGPLVAGLLARLPFDAAAEARIREEARRLVLHIRESGGGLGALEDFLHEYGVDTREGIALMVLAEALLRIPDPATQDRLIEEKLGGVHWEARPHRSDVLLVSFTSWLLAVGARLVQPYETPEAILAGLVHRLGQPAVRTAVRRAVKVLAHHFVLAEDIEGALRRAEAWRRRGYRFSFDMLGEGARTMADAERYFARYREAVERVAAWTRGTALSERDGISVKLSALHPRFEARQRGRVHAELYPRLFELARLAARHDLPFTIDAEEADRLEITLELFARLAREPELAGWGGLGIAVQAYQKRAPLVVAWLAALARSRGTPLMVRLVKGAYWDTEIKRAQERGLDDYPVFTRKSATDLCYLDCARALLEARPHLFPMFATHNALTLAAVRELAGEDARGLEFQRLHGMGEALHEAVSEAGPKLPCRIYAPVGGLQDLLAYLVRRLLENGANSSFVQRVRDRTVPVEALVEPPWRLLSDPADARHPKIPLPRDLFRPERPNSRGIEFGSRRELAGLLAGIHVALTQPGPARSLVGGRELAGTERPVVSPVDATTVVGTVHDVGPDGVQAAVEAALAGFARWSKTDVRERARILSKAADLLEARRAFFVGLLAVEAGKTLDDGIAEVREAADLLRYYGVRAVALMGHRRRMPGPVGEENRYVWRPRGVFACISPWNFPLAIFTGQIAAALACGNAVVAKPAEQTPLVAHAMVQLLHEAGVPADVLNLVFGDGTVGAHLVADPRIDGVAFTGSIETARSIHRALAAREGPIVPLVAETGGINAMIVDATALPEQVTDDVLVSAFRSAGQRCSALRLLCLQEEVADRMLEMITGAARELALGDPRDPATDIGPIIDAEALARLVAWIDHARGFARPLFEGAVRSGVPRHGFFLAPHVFELEHPGQLDREVFGPVLHVVRWRPERLAELLDAIRATGYALTLGIHTRLASRVREIVERLPVGNVYVNRNMIGAVVGSQPFGGHGLSGTGFKAGGPAYLTRFGIEQVVADNVAACGGNAAVFVETAEG